MMGLLVNNSLVSGFECVRMDFDKSEFYAFSFRNPWKIISPNLNDCPKLVLYRFCHYFHNVRTVY